MDDLEIRDCASGALIYRRLQPQHVIRRILRLETHLFPLWRLDNAMNGHFQYYANQIEACGRETTTQMLMLSLIPSVYLSGRLLFRAFEADIVGNFDVVFTMHHPYEELAERLIVLAQIKRTGSGILGLRENLSLEPSMAFAQALPLDNEKALTLALRDIPQNVARVLANPVVRQLTTTTPEAMPGKSAVAPRCRRCRPSRRSDCGARERPSPRRSPNSRGSTARCPAMRNCRASRRSPAC